MNLCTMLRIKMDELSEKYLKKPPVNFKLEDLRFPIIDHEGNPYNFYKYTSLDKCASNPIHPKDIRRGRDYVEFHTYPDDIMKKRKD